MRRRVLAIANNGINVAKMIVEPCRMLRASYAQHRYAQRGGRRVVSGDVRRGTGRRQLEIASSPDRPLVCSGRSCDGRYIAEASLRSAASRGSLVVQEGAQ